LQLHEVFRCLHWRSLFLIYEPRWWWIVLIDGSGINNFSGWLLKWIEICIVIEHIDSCLIVGVDVAMQVAASFGGFSLEHLGCLYLPHLLSNAFNSWCDAPTSVHVVVFPYQFDYFGRTALCGMWICACIRSDTISACVHYLFLDYLDVWLDYWTIFLQLLIAFSLFVWLYIVGILVFLHLLLTIPNIVFDLLQCLWKHLWFLLDAHVQVRWIGEWLHWLILGSSCF
jgi:hypothetical protein